MREDVRHESPRTHPQESSAISLTSGWVQQGVQSYFATQRILADLVMRQPSTVMHALQERLSDTRHSSAIVLSELGGEVMANSADAYKVLLDLVQRQNEIIMADMEERAQNSSAAMAMTNLLRQRVDTVIRMQREFLKIAGRQTRVWMADATSGKLPGGAAMADLARDAMDRFVSAEKQFLDAVAEATKTAAHGKVVTRRARKVKKAGLVDLGRRASESFVEAQKALVDVGARQMNANLKLAGKTIDMLRPLVIPPIAQWTRNGMKGVVEIQEAVANTVAKRGNGSGGATRKHRKIRSAHGSKSKATQ